MCVVYMLLFCTSLKESARESERQYQRPLADTIKKINEIKQISGFGSFVVSYFQPATSIDLLHYYYFTVCFCDSHKKCKSS